MATTSQSGTGIQETSHTYHAEADIIHGDLKGPVKQAIQTEALVSLNDRRENHFSGQATNYSLEGGLVSFQSGYTHVSGSRNPKNQGWVTLATSVIEGLKVLDVITVDRVVAQVSTEHPTVDGHVPHVTFLGTQIENLRIGGYPVQIEFALDICGTRPPNDVPYTSDEGFLTRLQEQCSSISVAPGLPADFQQEYADECKYLEALKPAEGSKKAENQAIRQQYEQRNNHRNGNQDRQRWGEPGWRPKKEATETKQSAAIEKPPAPPKVRCSLVKSISSTPLSKAFGNIVEIPGFGFLILADLEVSDYFELTMLNMKMGCIGNGQIKAGNLKSNGQTAP